ncbi:hypothetical protein PVAG01_04455 [Phlyctema vagabunda]|uniref:Uncharacterized protein n=1 Tax=Phlyctema vagabunda TaxID=108571 RepID=A0ABR4PPA2_9HELO
MRIYLNTSLLIVFCSAIAGGDSVGDSIFNTTNATKYASSVVPRSPNVKASRTVPNDTRLLEDPCNTPEFEYTASNVVDSRATQYYKERVDHFHAEYADALENIGQTRLWARHELGSTIFDCDMKDGCPNEPTCRDIFRHNMARFAGDREKATEVTRKSWLSLRKLVELNRFFRLVFDLIFQVEVDVLAELSSLISTFSLQKDPPREEICVLKRGLKKIIMRGMIRSCKDMIMMNIAKRSDLSSYGLDDETDLKDFVEASIEDALTSASLIRTVGQDLHDNDFDRAAHITEKPLLVTIANADCTHTSVGKPNENANKLGHFSKWLARDLRIRREDLHNLWNDINDGRNIYGTTTMVGWMERGHLPIRGSRAKDLEAHLLPMVSRKMKQSIIAMALATSKCYVKCSTKIHEHEKYCPWMYNPKWTPKKGNVDPRTYRKCYPSSDNPAMVCEVKCWSRNGDDKEVHLPGSDELSKYQLSGIQLIDNSKVIYYKYHNIETPGTAIDPSVQSSKVTAEAFLPTCIGRDVFMHEHGFPLNCGGRDSDETRGFLKALFITPDIHDDPIFDRIVNRVLPLQSNDIRPLNYELIYCAIGRHFHTKGEKGKGKKLELGRSPFCEEMQRAVKGMTENEANLWYCKSPIHQRMANEVVKAIDMKLEWTTSQLIYGVMNPVYGPIRAIIGAKKSKAPWTKCKKWLKSKGAKQKEDVPMVSPLEDD